MTGYVGPIDKVTEKNKYFRYVLFTGKHLQLVVMSLQAKEKSATKCMNMLTRSSGSRRAEPSSSLAVPRNI